MNAYLRANGFSPYASNFTVTKQGRHKWVRGGKFVPYSFVFDHHGKLVYHHMSGSYHGGDGWKMIEVVDELLKQTPVVYLGAEPFVKMQSLAKKIASGKGLASAIQAIEAKQEAEEDPVAKEELARLFAAAERYRDRRVKRAEGFVGTQPSLVLTRLKHLLRHVKGTSLAADVETRIETWSASADLKTAIEIEKKFKRIAGAYEKVKEKKRTDALVERTVNKLEALIEGHEDLPITETVEAFLADLR